VLQVDEDDAGQSDDEDELELLGGAQEGEDTQAGAASAKSKSVRMAVGDKKESGAGGHLSGKLPDRHHLYICQSMLHLQQ
jgi:hypothetical protein